MKFKKLINQVRDMRASLDQEDVDFSIEFVKLGEEILISFRVSFYFQDEVYLRKHSMRESEFIKSDDKVVTYIISKFFRDCKEEFIKIKNSEGK